MNKGILAVALLGLVVLATVEAGYPLKDKRMRKEKASIAKEEYRMEKLNAMKMKRKESTGVEAKRQKDTIARAYAELKKEYASGNINLEQLKLKARMLKSSTKATVSKQARQDVARKDKSRNKRSVEKMAMKQRRYSLKYADKLTKKSRRGEN